MILKSTIRFCTLLIIMTFLSFTEYSLKAQKGGNATLTMIETKVGARKHTEVLSLSMGMMLDYKSKEVYYSVMDANIFKGKSTDEQDQVFLIKVEDLEGEGTVNDMNGNTLMTYKNHALYFGKETSEANIGLVLGEYNVKKFQLFFKTGTGKKASIVASYKGKKLNATDTIFCMIALSERYHERKLISE